MICFVSNCYLPTPQEMARLLGKTFCEVAVEQRPILIKQMSKKWGWFFKDRRVEAEDVVDQAIANLHPDPKSPLEDFIAMPEQGRHLYRAANDIVIDLLRSQKRAGKYVDRAESACSRCARAITRLTTVKSVNSAKPSRAG